MANELARITTTVQGNEKAWHYIESHQPSPTHMGVRRYMIIVVVRDGELAEYREDMGPSSIFKGVRELNIPSFFEHNVDELRSMADEIRHLDSDRLDIDELLELDKSKYKLA